MSECNHAVTGSCEKCEPCGVCGRPKGDPHRYPVAGECTAPDSSDYTVSLQCLSIALRNARDDVKAAEERGRRSGVEEAEAIEAHAKVLADEADRRGTSIVIYRCPQGEWIIGFGENMQEVLAQEADFGNALFAATVMRALAPRDSGSMTPPDSGEHEVCK